MSADGHGEAGGRATPEQIARKHIYVINGSPEFLGVIRELLQDEHYNVTTTNFIPNSFETIETAQPSLLIVDLILGEQAGWDLLGRLHEAVSTRHIPVVLVSTTPRLLEEAKERHELFGGDRYLAKPFNLDDLLGLITELIGKA